MILRIKYGKIHDFGWMQLADNIIEILIIMGSTFVIFIVVFTLFQIILGAKVSDESEYPGLHPYFRKMIQTFRVSIGDLQVTNYS